MNRLFRTFVLLPAAIVALVVLPSIAFSKGDMGAGMRSVLNQTISPLPTPTKGTVPLPTATPTRRPYPTATPVYFPPTPTATPEATDAPAHRIGVNGIALKKVIGDRLSSVIYAYTTRNRLYRSLNDGASWRLVTSSPDVDDFVMSAANTNVLYSGKGVVCDGHAHDPEPMYKSVDGGVNWEFAPGADNLRPLLAHQGDAESLFAADCEQLYVTTDGGLTWAAKPDTSPDALWENYVAMDMSAASLLGEPRPDTPNWNQIFVGGIAEDGSGVVAFTNDMGDTWTRLTPNVFPSSWGMSAIAVDVFTEGLVAFAEPKGVWQTSNYGVNWRISSKGLETVIDRGLVRARFGLNDLVYHPSGRLYLATVRGLYTKELTAQRWQKVTGAGFDALEITSLLYTETNLDTLWLNTTDGVYTYSIPE
jgi:hypothetical protein